VMMRLRELIERAQHRPKVRKMRKVSKAAKRRRLEGKKRVGEKKRLRRELD
jgi:ribosome-associated protein